MLIQLADHLGYTRHATTAASKNVPLNRDELSSDNGGKDNVIAFPHGIPPRDEIVKQPYRK
jgi:hypothetical protein